VVLPDEHRNRGIHFVGASGSGKSLTLGYLAFFDLLRQVPQVVFDPLGQSIDAMLLRVSQLPKPVRRRLWRSIRYIDMSGRSVNPPRWPLLFDLPGNSLFEIAERFPATCLAIDSQLEEAPILGANALNRTGQPVGMILASLGLQLDEAPALLAQPERWLARLENTQARFPDAAQAIAQFSDDYMRLKPAERLTISQSYRAKLLPIILDPTLRGMLCSDPPSVNFYDVVDYRQTILLDFRGVSSPSRRLLLTRWAYDCLLAFIKHRGPGKHVPLAIHIDEIVELADQGSLGADRFAQDLDHLINILMRNSNLWVTAAHQQMWQLGHRSRETLLSMGTQLIGLVSDHETAELLARRYAAQIDPYRIKRLRNVWMQDVIGPYVVEREPVEFPIDEQVFATARAFLRLRPFEFFVKPKHQAHVTRATIADDMGPPWPNEHTELLKTIRHQLSLRETGLRYPTLAAEMPNKVAEPRVKIEDTREHDRQEIEKDIEDWLAEPPP
jgi:hypothetical protein